MKDNPILPINVNSEITARYDKSTRTNIVDTKVFKREENKECQVGLIRKKNFIFECGGEKPSQIREIIDNDSKIKKLKKLLDGEYISQEIYDKKIKKIMEQY